MLVCIAGKNTIAANVLHHVVQQVGADQVVVVPNSDDPGRHTWQHSLRQTAQELGVREVALADVYPLADLLFLSVEYNHIIKPSLFNTTNLYNIHFSHLPKYKGMYTSIWPILNGEMESGVTLHRIDKGIDTGDIIAQATFPIALHHTSREVYFNYLATGERVIIENFDHLLRGDFTARRQPAVGSTYYSKKSIDYSNLAVNFRATAFQVHNFVRGFSFYEYQLPHVFNTNIWKSEITDELSVGKPGEIVNDDEWCLVVNTIDYNVRLFKDYSQQLFAAAQTGDIAAARVAALTHDINITNRQGWSALMVAAYHHHYPVVKLLLAAGANVNQANLNGTTVLMYAKDGALRAGNDTQLLDYLLAQGAELNRPDAHQKTVLDYCRTNGNTELIAYLQAHGAS